MSIQAARESLGLPPPQSSSGFWAHILGKDPNTLSQTSHPPLTPLDRNATSTRVLLHDTQVNLEKFSTKADSLLNDFSEAKSELKLVNTLFERDRETLINDIIDLVNRCQTQLQKALGSPAQSSIIDQLSRDVSQRLENIDKRLDAIQTLSQTHAQSLQTQIRAIQAIQEQQCNMLATIIPLVPLLQAVPLHIDSAKNSLLDTLQKQAHHHTKATQTSPVIQMPTIRSPNKRSRTMSLSDNLTALAFQVSKRSRVEPEALAVPNRRSVSFVVNKRTGAGTPKSDYERHNRLAATSHSGPSQPFNRPQTPGPRHETVIKPVIHASLNPERCITTHRSPGALHTPTLGNRNLQPETTNATVFKDTPSPHTKKVEVNILALKLSGSRMTPPHQTEETNIIKRTTMHTPARKPKATQPPGTQIKPRQLKSATTMLSLNSRLTQPRPRRSPPKEGRRFIALLDSDEEDSITSP
ncbi:hypothetical protein AX15_003566 [Amanita polypyramis BW_CC]|nr:hypothetical protein AX15_003566 [Amanita polypyramis BW_CC]